jgi:hypothetical protein
VVVKLELNERSLLPGASTTSHARSLLPGAL